MGYLRGRNAALLEISFLRSLELELEPHYLMIEAFFHGARLMDTAFASHKPHTLVGPITSALIMASPMGGDSHIWKSEIPYADQDYGLKCELRVAVSLSTQRVILDAHKYRQRRHATLMVRLSDLCTCPPLWQ